MNDPQEIIRALGLVINNSFLYGATHGVTKGSIDRTFHIVSKYLDAKETVSISQLDGMLMIDGHDIDAKNPLLKSFQAKMAELDISSFTLTRGILKEHVEALIEVFGLKPEQLKEMGGFAGILAAAGIDKIKSKSIVYKQVAEDELVVNKAELENKGAGDGNSAMGGVIAFLNGNYSGDQKVVHEQLMEKASDPNELAELIMHTAEVSKSETDIEGAENFAGLVVGCLRKTYENITSDPASKTQKCKKNLLKTLMLLEKDVLEKLKELGQLNEEVETTITGAVQDLSDELKIDSLAVEYMKKKQAIDTNENQILKFIKSKGMANINQTELKDKLFEGGLTDEGWQELISKSGVAVAAGLAGFGQGTEGFGAIGHLAMLLTKMEDKVAHHEGEDKQKATEDMLRLVKEVHNEVVSIVSKTEKKIGSLISSAKEDNAEEKKAEKAGRPANLKLSRLKLLELLAEVVQELCQPLSVIGCSVDMIKSKALGEVNDTQLEMLNMASESGDRLKKLIDKLLEISGLPETMTPDQDIQDMLYK